MKAIIIGGGLIGVATAYFLASRGHQVTVIERRSGPGRETSFANGGLLTPSMSDPWNSPDCWRTLLASLIRKDSPLLLRPGAILPLLGWGTSFLRNSRRTTYARNTLQNLRLALYSREVMSSLREQLPLDYDHVAHGSLRIFRNQSALQRTLVAATQLSAAGVRFRALDRSEVLTLNPALTPIADQLAGGIHYLQDETGDAFLFCTRLADHARQLGVTFRLDTEVTSFESQSGKIVAAASATERFVGDTFIICAGSYSAPLLRHLRLDLPIRPAKGYSVSFDTQLRRPLPIPIVDDELHAVIITLGDTIRVAGTAEFAGYDTSIDHERVENLVRLLRRVLPEDDFDMSTAKSWCGLRPMSADGVPIIGATAIPNLFVNAGHGHLGWTMATGSARLLVDVLSNSRPEIDPAPYALARFQ